MKNSNILISIATYKEAKNIIDLIDKIREKIVMADTNIIALSSSMVKINKWSEKA